MRPQSAEFLDEVLNRVTGRWNKIPNEHVLLLNNLQISQNPLHQNSD